MRKIESRMLAAIKGSQDWHQANTSTETVDSVTIVKLYGHKIAEIGDTWLRIYDGGYQSKTTKSRLNAILSQCGLPGDRVYQQAWDWYLNRADGPVPFVSGMTV